MKSTILSRQIQVDGTFIEKDVLQVCVQNYGTDPVIIVLNSIEREIPPMDAALKIPSAPFRISDNNNEFDFEIEVKFPNGIGKVVVDFSKKQKC